jgi:hypothetical protein
MHHAGSPSWEVRVDRWSQRYDVPLWIRAAERINVPAGGVIPGPLEADVLPSPSLSVEATPELVSGWETWWKAVVDPPAVIDRSAPPEAGPYDPPDFSGLARWPTLQRVSRSRWPEIREWNSERKRAGIKRGIHVNGQIDSTMRQLELALGRAAAPFTLDLVLVPVRDDEVRRIGFGRYLVPEFLYDGPKWPTVVRDLLVPLA